MKLRVGKPEGVGMSAQRIGVVKDLARSWVDGGITASLVVLVARQGVIVLHEAFGHLGPGPESPPLERDAIFPLSSITKPITATAAMMLVEDGLLGLNRRVSDYIPEFCGEGKEAVMVHHLLTHTSGLRDEELLAHEESKRPNFEIPAPETAQHPAVNEVLFLGYDAPLWKPPGEEMSYCNFNYQLLGEIVRRLSGESLAEFARERIFQPLGMEDTHYVVPDSIRRRVVQRPPHAPFPQKGTPEDMDDPRASGGVYSTAIDMAVFRQMFLNRGRYGDVRILSTATVTEMTRNQIPGIGASILDEYHAEASWGYGWGIHGQGKWAYFDGTLHSSRSFWHSGSGGTYVWTDPVYEIVGSYFSVIMEMRDENTSKHNADLFVNAVTAAVQD